MARDLIDGSSFVCRAPENCEFAARLGLDETFTGKACKELHLAHLIEPGQLELREMYGEYFDLVCPNEIDAKLEIG
jgi:hypothetical protein